MSEKQLILNGGDSISFTEFTPKQSNLIKVRLHDNETNGEGIWACISDEDIKDYYKNVEDTKPCRVATLRNHALAFYPNESWGLCIPIRFTGIERPEFNLNWLPENFEPIFIMDETVE